MSRVTSAFEEQKAQIAQLLHGPVKTCRQEEALWFTDYPLRCTAEEAALAAAALHRCGYTLSVTGRGGWLLDMQRCAYESIFREGKKEAAHRFPASIAALMTLLLRHPASFADEPIEDLRLLFKASENPGQMEQAAGVLLRRSALRLRQHQPLAHHGAFFLMRYSFTKDD